jgi:hypothetical protein
MNKEKEIRWIETWLKKETKRAWVPWLKPIIAQNKRRLRELTRAKAKEGAACKESTKNGSSG